MGLTHGGRVLVDHVRRVIDVVDEAMSAVAETKEGHSGRVAIGVFNMGISILASPLVASLRAGAPELRIEVQQATSSAALRLLRQGEIDIAITCSYDFLRVETGGGLVGETLLSERLVLLAPKQLHLPIRRDGLRALATCQWVTGPRNSGLGTVLVRAGEVAGFVPQVKHRVIGAQNICDLAATETAATIVPRFAVSERLEHLIVPEVDLGTRAINVVTRTARRGDPNIALILRTLRMISAKASDTERLGVAS